MSAISLELEQTLSQLDGRSAAALEQLVRDALYLVRPASPAAVDANGWPQGYFERYAGCLAGDDWEPSADPPPEPTPE